MGKSTCCASPSTGGTHIKSEAWSPVPVVPALWVAETEGSLGELAAILVPDSVKDPVSRECGKP